MEVKNNLPFVKVIDILIRNDSLKCYFLNKIKNMQLFVNVPKTIPMRLGTVVACRLVANETTV